MKELIKEFPINSDENNTNTKVVARIKPTDQIYEVKTGEWVVLCGDF